VSITYRALPMPAGALSASRRKHAFRASAGATHVRASLRVWESEGGALSKTRATP
jgi:hypothetical protein